MISKFYHLEHGIRWIFSLAFLGWNIAGINGLAMENAIMGTPEVACVRDGVIFNMVTKLPFTGKLYVRNEYTQPECLADFHSSNSISAESSAERGFRVQFNQCGMRRQRIASPTQGMAYSITMIVQFHDTFVTSADKAYNVRCFYREQNIGITAEEIFVSPLTTSMLSVDHPIPQCGYSIRHTSVDGPLANYVRVGDPIVHVFRCQNSADGIYNMLVKECHVDDGKTNKKAIIGKTGCTLDPFIIQTPQYQENAMEVFAEATVFKWPDQPAVYFSCQLTLCLKEDPQCTIIVPPSCEDDYKSKMNARERTKREMNIDGIGEASERRDKPVAKIDFDLSVKRLIVLDIDHEPHEVGVDFTSSTSTESSSAETTSPLTTIPASTHFTAEEDSVMLSTTFSSVSIYEPPTFNGTIGDFMIDLDLQNDTQQITNQVLDDVNEINDFDDQKVNATVKNPERISWEITTRIAISLDDTSVPTMSTSSMKSTTHEINSYTKNVNAEITTFTPSSQPPETSTPVFISSSSPNTTPMTQEEQIFISTSTESHMPIKDLGQQLTKSKWQSSEIASVEVEDVTDIDDEIMVEEMVRRSYPNQKSWKSSPENGNQQVCYGIGLVIIFSCVTTILSGTLIVLTLVIIIPKLCRRHETNLDDRESMNYDPTAMYPYIYATASAHRIKNQQTASTLNLNAHQCGV